MERADRIYSKDEVMATMEPLISTWFNERFTGLTEPQSRAVPVIHQRKNILVSSPTGSGKTLTAFMSIINELTRYASEGTLEERVYCIYISPLKALANDINRNLNTPLAEMREVAERHGMNVPDIRVAVRSGDTSQYERQKMVKHPPHILITTPESMALILEAPRFRESLDRLEWLILDEIHDICDSKRGAFLSLTMERLARFCKKPFTRIGLSATLAPIEAIAGFLVGVEDGETRDVVLVESDSKKQLDLKVICPTDDMTTLSSEMVNSMMYDTLKELVDEHETTLVFTNTRSGAESVVYKLKERGVDNIEVHHSSLGKEIRMDVETRLKNGEIKCVVSSTSLELGIDIGSVDLVCQIGSPKSVAKGLQRIGRSGHSMGKVAKGRLLVFDPDDLVECAVMCRAAHRNNIDRVGIPENCLDVLAQTVVGMSLDARNTVDEAFSIVRGSYCYRNLTREKFLSVLKYLGSKDEYEGVYSKIWFDEEEGVFGRKKGSRMIYYMNLGTIPEEANYRVVTSHGSVAGELSEKFVERLAPRDVFVLGGRSFEFVRSKGMTAYVKEATGRKPTVPSWAGEMLPRSFDLSMDVAEFRREMSENVDGDDDVLLNDLCRDFDIDEGSSRSLISYFREQKTVAGMIPDDKVLLIEEYIDPSGNQRIVFHFPFGRRVNDALSRGYAFRLTNIIGSNVSVTMSDDSFMIGTSRKIDMAKIPGLLTSANLDTILRKAIKDSEIFKLRFRHTAARSFMILRNYMGRPISVNRQQVRSSYLLDALGDMDNMPVIEETYREVLEDDMDIKNAREVLDMIESGKMTTKVMSFTGTPSPFAHSIILSGFSDIVLMEDRSALLRELHRKVLYRAMGDDIKEFEFEEEQVVPYFRDKIGRIVDKSDVTKVLARTGPLQTFRERGRNIYAYSDADKKTVDGWVRDLINDGTLGTVFLDEPHVTLASEIPYYAAATVKERDLTDVDKRVLAHMSINIANSTISEDLELSEDVVFRSMRKLESMYLITRTSISGNNRWFFSPYLDGMEDKVRSTERIILQYLECFAPATVREISFALTVPESEVKTALEALVAEEEVSCGRFLISEADQYMRKLDHMRLRAGKADVFDFDTVERYRFSKGERFDSIEDYFKFYESAGNEIDVFNRVPSFDIKRWQEMRASGRIKLGRFIRGKVRFMMSEDADRFASIRNEPVTLEDEELLGVIERLGRATMRQLLAETGMDKDVLKESIYRLDRALRIVRSFDEKEDWGTENTYEVYRPEASTSDQMPSMMEAAIRAYGPIPVTAFRFILGLMPEDATRLASIVGASTIYVGDGHTPMLVMPDEIPKIEHSQPFDRGTRILSLFDPDLSSKWAEISSRYGDKWIFPILRDCRVAGALELWEMSGCIEVRSVDMDSPEMLGEVLDALDYLMNFFRMKGVDIVRIREILGKDVAEIDADMASVLVDRGFILINGFYAKGPIVDWSMSEDDFVSYVLRKQHAVSNTKFPTAAAAMAVRGYIRTDAEMLTRVDEKVPLKQLAEGTYVKTSLVPGFIGYTTMEMASIYSASKVKESSPDIDNILRIIRNKQPFKRKEIIQCSPLSMDRTVEILNLLMHQTSIYQDENAAYCAVPVIRMDRMDALRRIIRMHFDDFGIFSAEKLASFLGMRMGIVRGVLSEMVDDGTLVKGFLVRGDQTLYWMLKQDACKRIRPVVEVILLNTQDNLHLYLRDRLKSVTGASENVILKGTQIIGHFKGKLTIAGSKVEGFQGSDEAFRFLKVLAAQLGVSIGEKDSYEDEDWDVSEFYLRSNPGAF